MTRRRPAAIGAALAIAALMMAGCSGDTFPLTPTPVANATVTTLSGGSWSGGVILSDGTITPFNMTLIARGLGLTTGAPTQAQVPGTVEVSGDYQTASGLRGTVAGSLQGSLQNGVFQGIFNSDTPSCARAYAGPITESSAALVPSGEVPPGCPLTFSVQLSRERGPDCHYAISLDRQSFTGNGGSGVASVETGSRCTWAAESTVPWIQVVDPTPRVGSGSVAFTITPNGQGVRDGQLRFSVPSQTFTVRQGAACVLTLSSANATVPSGGGSGGIAVQGAAGCEWTAQSAVDWISVSPPSGTGPGTVTFTARSNPGLAREGTFSVAGQIVTVSQGSGCGLTVNPLSATVPMGGGSGTIAVAGVSGCGWTAQSNADWVAVAPAAGNGNGTVTYTAQANPGPPRQGTLTVAGQTLTISQGTCNSPTTAAVSLSNVAAGGATGTMSVAAGAGCPWTVQTSVAWIVPSATGGIGEANIALTVQPNPGAARQGTITVAGQAFTITQEALACIYELRPADPSPIPFAGGTRMGTVAAPAGCAWALAATVAPGGPPWLSVTPAVGVGTATFTYVATGNLNTTAARTGAIGLTGGTTTLTVAVVQNGDTTVPTVTITAPLAAVPPTVVRGPTRIIAVATDNQGIAGVQFTVDGRDFGPLYTTAPYEIDWTPGTDSQDEDEDRVFGARATDDAGNRALAVPVTVHVNQSGDGEFAQVGPR